MPLVFTQNDVTVSGHDYADVFGASYEYPRRYASKIRPGESFVYYRGRRTPTGENVPQAYLGVGMVGEIEAAPEDRLRCRIELFRPFLAPVYFKVGNSYWEPGANRAKAVGFFFQVGVREIDQASFDAIVEAGLGIDPRDL